MLDELKTSLLQWAPSVGGTIFSWWSENYGAVIGFLTAVYTCYQIYNLWSKRHEHKKEHKVHSSSE